MPRNLNDARPKEKKPKGFSLFRQGLRQNPKGFQGFSSRRKGTHDDNDDCVLQRYPWRSMTMGRCAAISVK
ncbi:hypothetical protein V6Z11_D09G161700 [Gossypium hirsutum]